MEILTVGLLGGMAYFLTQDRTIIPSHGEENLAARTAMNHKDNREAGIWWGNQRVGELNTVELNNAHKPYSAPRQKPTYNLDDIARDQASRSAFVSAFHPDFFWRRNIEIPYTSAAAGVYQGIELPGKSSIRGDPGASLVSMPRVYINPEPSLYADNYHTEGAMGASEAEVWAEPWVPPTGQLNYDQNPYGPGGAVQKLYNSENEKITRKLKTNRSVILGPPWGKF